jgi:hypothetical protein
LAWLGIALWVIGVLKLPYHDKVEAPIEEFSFSSSSIKAFIQTWLPLTP